MSHIEILNILGKPHSIDIWALGMILLEVLSGIPNFMSYKCLINNNIKNSESTELKTGLFAFKG